MSKPSEDSVADSKASTETSTDEKIEKATETLPEPERSDDKVDEKSSLVQHKKHHHQIDRSNLSQKTSH